MKNRTSYLFARLANPKTSGMELPGLFKEIITIPINGENLRDAVLGMQKYMIRFPANRGAIDVCGTGGSGKSTINTSTIVAFVVRACGVPVIKHCGGAATGKCGSLDVLAKLGIRTDLSPKQALRIYRTEGIVFLTAGTHNPSLGRLTSFREVYGRPTIFNLLGPLLNPARPRYRLVGVSNIAHTMYIAEALSLLGVQKSLVVTGEGGIDEATPFGTTTGYRSNGEKPKQDIMELASVFDINRIGYKEIRGDDAALNADIAKHILAGSGEYAHMELVLVNAALALHVARGIKLERCYEKVQRAISSGKAREVFERYKTATNVA